MSGFDDRSFDNSDEQKLEQTRLMFEALANQESLRIFQFLLQNEETSMGELMQFIEQPAGDFDGRYQRLTEVLKTLSNVGLIEIERQSRVKVKADAEKMWEQLRWFLRFMPGIDLPDF